MDVPLIVGSDDVVGLDYYVTIAPDDDVTLLAVFIQKRTGGEVFEGDANDPPL